MEVWTVYDRDRRPTGQTIERGTKLGEDEYHMVIHVCIINSDNQMLIQQRQSFKEGWPNLWDISVGGSSTEGEDSRTAAKRELFEELGYSADLSNARPFFTINFCCGFDDFYILEDNVEIEDLKLQYEEVQAVRWASKDEILSMIDDKTFIPYHKSVIEMVFEMRHNRGGHSE